MDTQTPNPQIMPASPQTSSQGGPQASEPPVYTPVPSGASAAPGKPPFQWDKYLPIAAIVGLVLVVAIVSAVFFSRPQAPTQQAAAPTATATPTPTPQRILSSYATASAFTKLEGDVTNFPTTVQNAVLLDQTLQPPQLVLPLGFSN